MKYTKLFISLVVILCLGFIYFFLIYPKSNIKVIDQKNTNQPESQAISINTIPKILGKGSLQGVDASQSSWTFERYQTLMLQSGRKPGIDANTFLEIQKRKQTAKIGRASCRERV